MKFYGSCEGAAICFFFSPPPFSFFMAIPQSIKPLLSAPPLPAKVCVHFKTQHFGFQSSPWEFSTSFRLQSPLLILLFVLIEIYLFTSIGTYCSQPLGPSPPLALSSYTRKLCWDEHEHELLCLTVPWWFCIEGYSEAAAWMMLVLLWEGKAAGTGLLCKASYKARSTFHLKTWLAPNIKHESRVLCLCLLSCTAAIVSPCCHMKRELNSTCFWKWLLHMLQGWLCLVTGGGSFPFNIWVGFMSHSLPGFLSGRWNKIPSAVTGGPLAEHTETAGYPASCCRNIGRQILLLPLHCSISKPKQPSIVNASLQHVNGLKGIAGARVGDFASDYKIALLWSLLKSTDLCQGYGSPHPVSLSASPALHSHRYVASTDAVVTARVKLLTSLYHRWLSCTLPSVSYTL